MLLNPFSPQWILGSGMNFRLEGAPHAHGLLWSSFPVPSVVDWDSPAARAPFADFWADYITAVNPHETRPANYIYLSSVSLSKVSNTLDQLTASISRFQRYTACKPGYCLIYNRDSGKEECRFGYPQPLRDVPDVVRRRGKGFLKFAPIRNDILLNPINAVMVMGWKTNIDLTPCTIVVEVLAYTAKYASKAEKQLALYKKLIDRALKSISVDTSNPILRCAQKVLNTFTAEWDWSAQEVSYILIGLPLVESTRAILDFYCSSQNTLDIAFELENELTTEVSNHTLLRKYQNRKEDYDTVPL